MSSMPPTHVLPRPPLRATYFAATSSLPRLPRCQPPSLRLLAPSTRLAKAVTFGSATTTSILRSTSKAAFVSETIRLACFSLMTMKSSSSSSTSAIGPSGPATECSTGATMSPALVGVSHPSSSPSSSSIGRMVASVLADRGSSVGSESSERQTILSRVLRVAVKDPSTGLLTRNSAQSAKLRTRRAYRKSRHILQWS